jgi:THO complex subunit 7
MAVAHDEATMELIKTRLSHSERPLIRLMRSFYKLTMISTGTVEDERTAEELKIAHMNFLLDLRQLVRTLKELKGTRAVELNRSESLQLEIERVRLEEQALDEKLKIKNLESQLDQARRDRKNKMQYEEIGKEVRRFSDRFQSAEFGSSLFSQSFLSRENGVSLGDHKSPFGFPFTYNRMIGLLTDLMA